MEAKLAKLRQLRELKSELQRRTAGKQREYMPGARPKQLPPDHPRHHLPDANGFRCGCAGNDHQWMIWVLLAGRGFGKSKIGSNWLVHQATKYPGSEWAVFAPTFRDARKTCIEGSTGILAALRDGELGQYRRNELQIILANGSVIYGYSADQPERARGANLHGAWCVARGELVLTAKGEVPIEDVRSGMRVWTRKGWRRVVAQQLTTRSAPVVCVKTASGAQVRLTGNHRVWTQQRGWVEARALEYGDILSVWNSSLVHPLGSNGKASAGTAEAAEQATTQTAQAASSTWPYGNDTMANHSRTGTSSTTSTTTWPTTTPTTCNCSPAPNTYGTTTSKSHAEWQPSPRTSDPATRPVRGKADPCANTAVLCAVPRSRPRGSEQSTAHPAVEASLSAQIIESAATLRCRTANANGAATSSFPGTAEPCTAETNVANGQAMLPSAPETVRDSAPQAASCAALRSLQRTDGSASAPTRAESGTHVVSVEPSGQADVFDIQVEDAHEFTAGGILVHNCDELGSWRYEQTWHEGLVPALRKGENPRIVVTTTPRPTPLIRQLVGRNDGSVHLTRGSTWENAANLSPTALAELKRRYEGTRLGRKELEGELLDDIEGALWARDDIDAARVTLEQVPDLVRVVVAVDPAVTSGEDSDETGIVVVGESGNKQGYVLADYSMRGSPDACMRRAVRAYRDHAADCIVAETNNGGDYLGAVLRAVDPDVPYRTVRASRGKAVRAEPVAALYEQRRVHHVGLFPQLEDQMATWTPDAPGSPDRVDALVWGLTELKGLSMGSWGDAYGVARCGHCGQTFMADLHPDRCPHCRRPREAA